MSFPQNMDWKGAFARSKLRPNLGYFRRAAKYGSLRLKETTMKPSLEPGLSTVKRIEIDRDRTISFMGEDARVYATPRLISDIEFTCRDLILQHADPGEDSVGTEVCVKHLAATLAGSTV